MTADESQSAVTITTVTKPATEYPKVCSDETIRKKEGQLQQTPSRLTAYERYVKYGHFPRKKNARKRVAQRIKNDNQKVLTVRERQKALLKSGI